MMQPLFSVDSFVFIPIAALLGLIVGSFCNVVIYRLPKMLLSDPQDHAGTPFNLAIPRSHCPHCHTVIAWYHNVPIVGYLWLKGRCHHCEQSFGKQYFLIEILYGALFAFFAWRFNVSWFFLAACCYASFAVTLSMIDIKWMLLPDSLTLPLLWLGLWFNLDAIFVPLNFAVVGAMVGYLCLWGIYWIFKLLTGREGLGYGDFKLFAAIGAFLGWITLPFVALVAALMALIAIILRSLLGIAKANQPISFGPFLMASSLFFVAFWPEFLRFFIF